MSIVSHPKKWWNFCVSEDEDKEREPILLKSQNFRSKCLNVFSIKIIHKDLI